MTLNLQFEISETINNISSVHLILDKIGILYYLV